MGRKVGQRIRDIAAMLEAKGPMGALNLSQQLPDIPRPTITRYCLRAVGLGLMTYTTEKGKYAPYFIFTVVPGWEDLAGQRRSTKVRAKPIEDTPEPRRNTFWSGASSVFGVGA